MKVFFGDVAVVVKDGKASAAWWTDKIGFELREDSGHWITVAPKGSEGIVLHLCQNGTHEEGNTGIGFYVDDLDEVHKEWSAKGVRFTKMPTQGSASKNAMFADPDGNEYWLFEDEDLRK